MADKLTSKVTLKTGEVLIDLTQDDVKAEHVQDGIYFHDKTGLRQKGTNTKTVDASNATAEAAEVLFGRTFGKGVEMQTGAMPDNSGKNVVITDKAGAPIPVGYSDGSGRATLSDADLALLVPGNIKEGVTILNVPGAYGADDISSQSKTVTPTFEKQVINPDEGYTFLSSVEVEAIKVDRKDNEAGGVTVTKG
jgi:hypothetical protein